MMQTTKQGQVLAGDSQLTDNCVMDCIGHTHCNMFSLVSNDTLISTVIGLTGIIDQLKTLKYFRHRVSTFLLFTSFPALHQFCERDSVREDLQHHQSTA